MLKLRAKTKKATAKQIVVRFRNSQIPRAASKNADSLAAVCCPAFSL